MKRRSKGGEKRTGKGERKRKEMEIEVEIERNKKKKRYRAFSQRDLLNLMQTQVYSVSDYKRTFFSTTLKYSPCTFS